ncbi:MAG TPA: RagB/SusD family nutrient uptake outer membrane protein [Prolixibacteraceae bacterium]|nr:RagB/SusD family nutrient uptake outer membrane protein [Prolixibacteraceae bacterium]
MKNIFKIRLILIFFALSLHFSCSDSYLELLPPSGLVIEEFWKTKEDVEAVLMGAYQTTASMNGSLFTYGEVRGDMVKAGSNLGANERQLMESNIYPENSLCNWGKFYTAIHTCNDIIKNAPEVQKIDKTFTDFQLKNFMAEAIFIRSLNYFYLVRLFKDVPLVLEPSTNDAVDFYPFQTNGDDVLKLVLKDLNEYRDFATDGYKTIAEVKGRATKGAFDALLTDISLWMFDYEKCIEFSDRIIESPNFVLMPGARWFEIFYPGNSLESIFEFQFNESYNQPNSLYQLTSRSYNQYEPSQRANELFAREYAIELTRGEDVSITKIGEDNYKIWKYVGRAPDGKSERSGADQRSCNWIVYRLSDVYLMKAEALSQLGRFAEAVDILNMIRTRANVVQVSLANSTNAFEDAIMDERARELAFEGKRWFDLLRMGRRNNYARKDKLVELIINNVPSTQKRILSAKLTNPLGWYLPVYKDEMERNKNLIQNRYYNN